MENNASIDVDKLITFGQMALEQGWYDQAREYFEQALALDASNREAMKGLARVNEILSRREAAAAEPIQDEPVELPAKSGQERVVRIREMARSLYDGWRTTMDEWGLNLMSWFGKLSETGKIVVIASFLIKLVCCWGVIFGEQEQTGTSTWQQSKTTSY